MLEDFEKRMRKEVLKSAVCRQIFCFCGNILDVRSAVMVEFANRMIVMCGKCFHEPQKGTGKAYKDVLAEAKAQISKDHPMVDVEELARVYDGKELSRKIPKGKFPKDMRSNPVKSGFLAPTEKEPSMAELDEMVMDSVCPATDGCEVEPDGKCEHGHVSWLRYLGIV